MTRHQEVANHADVRKHIPALAALADGIGDRQVRAMGTMGGSVANNDPAACYPSAVLGLGATVHTDRRTIAADDFFQGLYTTALDAGELITAISFPVPTRSRRTPSSASPLRALRWWACSWRRPPAACAWPSPAPATACSAMPGWKQRSTRASRPMRWNAWRSTPAKLNGDLHASAAYRAHLIKVQTQMAVEQANG